MSGRRRHLGLDGAPGPVVQGLQVPTGRVALKTSIGGNVEVRHADVADLAVGNQLGQGLRSLHERRGGVRPTHLVQTDVVGGQGARAGFHRVATCRRRSERAPGLYAPRSCTSLFPPLRTGTSVVGVKRSMARYAATRARRVLRIGIADSHSARATMAIATSRHASGHGRGQLASPHGLCPPKRSAEPQQIVTWDRRPPHGLRAPMHRSDLR
jgi:hypothetical protein